jgi:hypothetical protein
MLATPKIPAIQIRKFNRQNCGLECVQPEIPARLLMNIFWVSTMNSNSPEPLSKVGIACDNGSSVSAGA